MRHLAVVEVVIVRAAARRSVARDRLTLKYCRIHLHGSVVSKTSRVMSPRRDGASASAALVELRSVELMKAEYMG
jgi:hypothetical protein